jgi:SAM-dependent MidA family methyltransferase
MQAQRPKPGAPSVSTAFGPAGSGAAADDDTAACLRERIADRIREAGGWLPFDRFMAMALAEPGLGYYARGARTFGTMPADGSDFATAPEMSPLFARALARQVAEALDAGAAPQVTEFGAGSGALAADLLSALDAAGAPGGLAVRYQIVEVSAALRARQAERLARYGDRVRWLDAWPARIDGIVIGNEVLDALPVQLLHWDGAHWWERGVACAGPREALASAPAGGARSRDFVWADRPTGQRPPSTPDGGFVPGTTIEIHPQAEAFVAGVAERLDRGLALFVDYGFPEAEYYHPQRIGGTLMCHRGHRSDMDPLADVGEKDITAHVNFTGIALSAQAAGAEVLGYTSQARFLFDNGLLDDLAQADVTARAAAHRLVAEHEMGELFKVIAFSRDLAFGPDGRSPPRGFRTGDRSHRL